MSVRPELKPEKAKTLFDSLSLLQMGELNTREEFQAFYVPSSEARNAEEHDRTTMTLLSIQASRTPCHILFSGHLGCGKSTELWRLWDLLEENRYLVAVGECEDNLDMNTVQYTDLILFILETLLKCARDNKVSVNKKSLANIEEYWNTVHTIVKEDKKGAGFEVSGAVEGKTPSLLQVFSLVASARSLLRSQSETRDEYRKVLAPRFGILIGMVNDVIEDIRRSGVKKGFQDAPPVVLLNDLEKANRDTIAELFDKHSQDLVRLRLHPGFRKPIVTRPPKSRKTIAAG